MKRESGSLEDAEHPRRYFSRAPELAKTERWFWDDDFMRGLVVPLCEIRSGSRILDVGCGTGALGRRLHPFVQPDGEIVGLELQAENVQAGNEFNHMEGFDRIQILEGDARKLGDFFPQASFDVVAEVGMLCLLRDEDERKSVFSQMVELAKPGGSILSLEIDLSAIISDLPLETRILLSEWVGALTDGMTATAHEDMRLGPRMPQYFFEAGLQDIKVKAYVAPEPFPPFSDETLSLAADFGAWFNPASPAHEWIRWYLVRGGMTDERIDELCKLLGAWWDERMSVLRQNLLPPLMTQVFLLTLGRRPGGAPQPRR